jgi:hypothetical protein
MRGKGGDTLEQTQLAGYSEGGGKGLRHSFSRHYRAPALVKGAGTHAVLDRMKGTAPGSRWIERKNAPSLAGDARNRATASNRLKDTEPPF